MFQLFLKTYTWIPNDLAWYSLVWWPYWVRFQNILNIYLNISHRDSKLNIWRIMRSLAKLAKNVIKLTTVLWKYSPILIFLWRSANEKAMENIFLFNAVRLSVTFIKILCGYKLINIWSVCKRNILTNHFSYVKLL